MQEVSERGPRTYRTGIDLLICALALTRLTDGTVVRNKKTASRRLFESIALTWGVELRGFEPRTSCMPCKRSTN